MKTGTKVKIIATIACAFALCLALVGCGSTGASDDGAAAFEGDWVLSGGTYQGDELDQTSIDAMQTMGMNVYVQLNADGSMVINMFTAEMEGTWKATSATTADVTLQGDTEEVKIVDGELVMEANGDSLRFKKGEIPEGAAATTPDAEESATPEA